MGRALYITIVSTAVANYVAFLFFALALA